jgi:hypothetical protein
MMGLRRHLPTALVLSAAAACLGTPGAAAAAAPTWTSLLLPGTSKRVTEPRVIVGPDDRRWVATNLNTVNARTGNDSFGDAVVFSSRDGGQTFQKTEAEPPQQAATIDVDVVAMHPVVPGGQPRILASELDAGGLNFPSGVTDDGGKSWKRAAGGTQLADQDRQWFAVGPDDKTTKKPTVYLLYHNLGSGFAQHNMFVSKSVDGGEIFGQPVPVTLPGSDAYSDLQCADSGGPSSIAVNQRTGRIYVFFTTRGAPQPGGMDFGGCAAMPLEFNIVNATRVWVATSPDGSNGSWGNHLAVDDAKTGQVVSMQLAYGALDKAGNVYVAYPESPKPYPHLESAAVKLVTQRTDGTRDLTDAFTKPATLVPAGGPGSLLVHLAVGDPGKLDVAYFKGKDIGAKDPVSKEPGPGWFLHVVQSLNALDAAPTAQDYEVSDIPAYTWNANRMMGLCSDPNDPTGGVQNGVACDRSTDVFGVALDENCRLSVTWPVTKPHNSVAPEKAGTWVSTQTGGDALCGAGQGPPAALAAPAAQSSSPSCRDLEPPVTAFSAVRARRTRIRLSGTGRDSGCGAALRSVRVAVARGVGAHRCRFLRGDGTFGRPIACRNGRSLVSVGLSRWTLSVKGRFPRGRYIAWSRATDVSANRERAARVDRTRFRVR